MKNIKSLNKFTLTNIKSYGIVLIAFLILFPMQSAGLISNSISGQLVPICTYIVMAISLSLTVGFLGELSLGHAGFMSVGAFTGVIAASCLSTVVHSNALLLFLSVLSWISICPDEDMLLHRFAFQRSFWKNGKYSKSLLPHLQKTG